MANNSKIPNNNLYIIKGVKEYFLIHDIMKVMEANEKANDRMVAVNKLRFNS